MGNVVALGEEDLDPDRRLIWWTLEDGLAILPPSSPCPPSGAFFPVLEEEEELLGAGPAADGDPCPSPDGAAAASDDGPTPPEEDGFTSLPAPPLDFEAPLEAPFLSLSLLKNLNLSNIEFLLLEDEEEVVEGLDDVLLEEEVDDVDPALVLLTCLSAPPPGRPRPRGVGIPETGAGDNVFA